MPPTSTPATPPRRERLVHQLKQLFEQASGGEFADANPGVHFLELGVDSLLMTQLALRLKQTFRVPVTFRQIMEDTPTFSALAEYLDGLGFRAPARVLPQCLDPLRRRLAAHGEPEEPPEPASGDRERDGG